MDNSHVPWFPPVSSKEMWDSLSWSQGPLILLRVEVKIFH
jgi:hypothetical protein